MRGDHQLAHGVDEYPLPEYALRGERAVVIGPPLIAIAASWCTDIGLFCGSLRKPALGHNLLAARSPATHHEHAETGHVARCRLNAATADRKSTRLNSSH